MNSSTYDVTYIITYKYNVNGKLLSTTTGKKLTSLKSIVQDLGVTDNYSTNPLYKRLVRLTGAGTALTLAIKAIFGGNK